MVSRRRFLSLSSRLAVTTVGSMIPFRVSAARRSVTGASPLNEFGVRADGIVDDTMALQKALDRVAGGVLELPPGTYKVSSPGLIVRSSTTVVGRPGAVLLATQGKGFGLLNVAPGSVDIGIESLELKGPWADATFPAAADPRERARVWKSMLSESVGINAQGVWHMREIARTLNPGKQGTPVSSRIRVSHCSITGFGQSGVFVDNVSGFEFRNNTIMRCGRDGLRMYGVEDGTVVKNIVKDVLFGFDGAGPFFNVYGITATRVYGNAKFPDPDCRVGRRSRRIIISDNIVRNVATWKSLDTHGGSQISFLRNTCDDSHIGIGIDKGGWDEIRGFAPPTDILIAENTLTVSPGGVPPRAGITAYAHDDDSRNLGLNLKIERNRIYGYGGEKTDGAISISNYEGVEIVGNALENSLRSGICLDNRVGKLRILGNNIHGVRKTTYGVAYGILFQTADVDGELCNNTVSQPISLPALSANVSLEASSLRESLKICGDNVFSGRSEAAIKSPR